MDLYYSHIVELLVKNIGIKPMELYKISGIESKRDFLKEINQLILSHRIIRKDNYQYIRKRYSPKVLYLWEYEKDSERPTKIHEINFLPTSELEREFGYVNNGTEQEDCLEFELQITGYQITEKHQAYFENHTGLTLNFEKNRYYLWAKFLDPFKEKYSLC